ncbi:MAG: scramblase [Chloroflexi bacterium]|nr:scramblase [Chloroflexota bacterium]
MINIADHPELIIKQEVEHLEAFTGIETENRYSVMTPAGERLLYAAEESSFLGRFFLKSHRPLTLHVVDGQGRVVFEASRSFFWFFSHLHVSDASGRNLGSLRRQFSIMVRRFTVEDADGRPVAEVRGPILRPNTFTVYRQGTAIARITKRWSGLLKEVFTDADTFRLELLDRDMEPDSALLVLATAFAIDLDFFES